MAKNMYSPLPVRSPHTAARCKLPFALCPGLSPNDIWCSPRKLQTKDKGKNKRMRSLPCSSTADAMNEGGGKSGSPPRHPAPSTPLPPSSLFPVPCAPIPTPRLPQVGPASPHPWLRGSLVCTAGCTFRQQGGPRSSTGSSPSQSPLTPQPTGSSAGASTQGTP